MTYQVSRAVSSPCSWPIDCGRQVVVDDPAGGLDQPLQVLAVVAAVAVHVDLADQGEPLRLGRAPGGRVDLVAVAERVGLVELPPRSIATLPCSLTWISLIRAFGLSEGSPGASASKTAKIICGRAPMLRVMLVRSRRLV